MSGGGIVERVPSFQAERTPSEWERAFLAEQAQAMGGVESMAVASDQSFNTERTPSEWERAFHAEQAAAMGEEAPLRSNSFSQMSPEDLEKEFMRQMMECMGGVGMGGGSFAQSSQSPQRSPRRGVSSARTGSEGSSSSSVRQRPSSASPLSPSSFLVEHRPVLRTLEFCSAPAAATGVTGVTGVTGSAVLTDEAAGFDVIEEGARARQVGSQKINRLFGPRQGDARG